MADRACRVCACLEDIADPFVDGICGTCQMAINAEIAKRQSTSAAVSAGGITAGGLGLALQAIVGIVLAVAGTWQVHSIHSPLADGCLLAASGWMLLALSRRR